MALRTSMVRFTDNSRVFAARSYTETVDGDEPPATTESDSTQSPRAKPWRAILLCVEARVRELLGRRSAAP